MSATIKSGLWSSRPLRALVRVKVSVRPFPSYIAPNGTGALPYEDFSFDSVLLTIIKKVVCTGCSSLHYNISAFTDTLHTVHRLTQSEKCHRNRHPPPLAPTRTQSLGR